MLRRIAIACCASVLGLAAPAGASDRVAKALLEALRANGTIDAKQYEQLNLMIEDEAAAEAAQPAVAAPPPSEKHPNAIDVYWKDGLRFDSANGAFKFRIGGRLQNDWGVVEPDQDIRDFFGSGDAAGQGTGTDWRRVRMWMGG